MKTNIIYNENCLDGMKRLGSVSVDLIITDPPYNVLDDDTLQWDDNKLLQEFENENVQWLNECYRILKDNRQVYVFWSQKLMELFYETIKRTDFEIKRMLIWHHPNLCKLTNKMFLWSYDPIFYLTKGKTEIFNVKFSLNDNVDVMRYAKPQRNFINEKREHPTSKPVELISKLMNISSNENDLVLDPFMGGGTTAISALKLHRKYIGFEIAELYYKNSLKRIEAYQQQLELL